LARKTTPVPRPKAEPTVESAKKYDNPPMTLDKHIFYGLQLDEDQKTFRDAIWNPDNKIVFCDAAAGSGKTLIAVATANLMVRYRLYDEIIYITSACHERKQGYLAGDLHSKSEPYFYPLYDALTTIGEMPEKVVKTEDLTQVKQFNPYITAMTDSYIRGRNFGGSSRVIVVADECQNMTTPQLRTLLSRTCDNALVIAIGHQKQIDISNPRLSGFVKCIEHFSEKEWASICKLTKNYRGDVSQWADLLPD
jgi:predicted ribonuclease YlaK